jgi:hypothetical protein
MTMSIFDRPANYDQRFYNEAPHRRVEPIAPSNPTQNQEPGHVSEYPQQDKQHVSVYPERDKVRHVSDESKSEEWQCLFGDMPWTGCRVPICEAGYFNCTDDERCPGFKYHNQAAKAKVEMDHIIEELEREAVQKGLKVDIIV